MSDIRLDRDGALLIVTLDRPKANALNAAMVDQLHAAIDDGGRSGGARRGAGELQPQGLLRGLRRGRSVRLRPADHDPLLRPVRRCCSSACAALPKPVVAAMSGHAYAAGAICGPGVRRPGDGRRRRLCAQRGEPRLVLPARMIRAMALSGGPRVMRDAAPERRCHHRVARRSRAAASPRWRRPSTCCPCR